MLGESHEAKTVLCGPKLYFTIVSSSSQEVAIRGVGHCVKVKEMSLLLEDICFTLPLPDEKLAKFRTAQHYPVTRNIEPHRVDGLVRDGETVDQTHIWQ